MKFSILASPFFYLFKFSFETNELRIKSRFECERAYSNYLLLIIMRKFFSIYYIHVSFLFCSFFLSFFCSFSIIIFIHNKDILEFFKEIFWILLSLEYKWNLFWIFTKIMYCSKCSQLFSSNYLQCINQHIHLKLPVLFKGTLYCIAGKRNMLYQLIQENSL